MYLWAQGLDEIMLSILKGSAFLPSRSLLKVGRNDPPFVPSALPGILNRMALWVRNGVQRKLASIPLVLLNVGMESVIQVSYLDVPAVLDEEIWRDVARISLISVNLGHRSPFKIG